MLSRRTTLLALTCAILASGCSKNDLVEDTQSVREKLIEVVGAGTEVYSVTLLSADKAGAGATQATVRYKDGDDIKLKVFMLWGPESTHPPSDDDPREDDPETPVRVEDIDFSEVAANVTTSKPLLPDDMHFMSVSSYDLPIGKREAKWKLAAGFVASASSRRRTVEYSTYPFTVSATGDVVALPE